MVFNKITELIARLRDGAGNSITSTDLGDGKRGLDISGTITTTVDKARIRDATDANKLLVVDSNGNIGVVIFNSGVAIDPRAIRALTSSDVVSAVQSGTWNINNISGTIAEHGVWLRDGDISEQRAKVDASGNLLVKTPTPEAPAGTIRVEMMARDSVSGSGQTDVAFVIPSNTVLILQRFLGGQFPVSGDASELGLYYDTTGAITASSYLISLGYVGTGEMNYKDDLSNSYSGNATRAIIARRRRLNATAREMYYRWLGYLTYNTYTTNESGTTTAVNSTTITDSTKNWVVNVHVGRYVMLSDNTPLKIVSNTATALTVVGNSQLVTAQNYKIVTFNA